MPDSERLLRDLQAIMAVSRAMGSERQLDRLLDLILGSASRLIDAQRSSLFLVDHERGELYSSIAQHTTAIRMPIGSGIAGSVATTGQAINIPEAYADPRFNPENDRRSGFQTRSILCMPLVNYAGLVVGVIQALNKHDGQPFTAYDQDVLGALCSQAAVAIDNAQLIARDLERQRMARDLELASQIQLGLLPQEAPTSAHWALACWARPCDQTGGDYFDFMEPAGGGLDVVVGDVSGHGITAALLMSTARASLRALHGQEPALATLMARLNRLLEQDMSDDTFMSMVLCRLADDGGCAYVAAGHEPPMVHRLASGGFDQLDSTGLLLGLMDDSGYETVVLPPLARGDLLLCFTDGIWEAQRDGEGEAFGMERLRAAVRAGGSAQEVCVRVIAAVQAHLGVADPADDMTLVVAERL